MMIYPILVLEDHPLDVIEFPCLDVLYLEIFAVPGLITTFEDKDGDRTIPYAEVVSLIPRLLSRLKAVRFSVLKLGFSAPDIDQAPDTFLDHLRAIHDPMEEMILGSCFPNLKAITFDLGPRPTRDIPSWQSRITKCFPKLEKVVSVQVVPYDNMRYANHVAFNQDFYSRN